MEKEISEYFEPFSQLFNKPVSEVEECFGDLVGDEAFLAQINAKIKDVPEFGGKQFTHVSEMRVFRCMLYLLTRIVQPEIFVETGVHNGMSSAFILLGMKHNGKGKLHSVDLPPLDQRILDQGTNELPDAKLPGWIIPDELKVNHDLRLEYAQIGLPKLLNELGAVDLFLHDSDHEYTHIMFEIGLAWSYLKDGGLIAIDNVEQNDAFDDFARATNSKNLRVSSFEGSERTWQHGLIVKSA
jgi:predicted O-methyltransferase YrrM